MNADKRRFFLFLSVLICVHLRLTSLQADAGPTLREVCASSDPQAIEVRGVGASEFDPKIWQAGKLNWVRDTRWPMIEPREGKFRNIYAPSVVRTPTGWAVFYGGWDGASSGNDRIYRVDTADFITFGARRTIIENGDFQHVCNVSVVRDQDRWAMLCTVYPDHRGRNRPASFLGDDGESFNTSQRPHAAIVEDIVNVTGYDGFDDADINGMNVLLRDGERYRMYFGNFRDHGKTFRATSDNGKHFTFDGVALQPSALVNDVKRFDVAGETWYLMALHHNGDRIFYTLSRDGMKFPEMRTLASSAGEKDRFIVAAGWVADEARVLGVLYGAGAAGSLDQNRIFALWLQKKLAIEGVNAQPVALGPDRQLIAATEMISGEMKLFSEDGQTLIGCIADVGLKPGVAYEIIWNR